MSYRPPYRITDGILSLVAEISEKLGRITESTDLDAKPHLRKNNRIRSIHSSLAIEANSLSLEEVRDVINGRLVIGEQREIREVKNAYDAYGRMGELDIYSLSDLKKLHGVMTKYTVEQSGSFRRGEEGVFSGGRCIFMAPPAERVPGLMEDLFTWLKNSRGEVHPLLAAAIFHYEFVFIHPFTDGNGRMARLWHTAILSRWKPIFEFIPIESRIESFQEGYYAAIARCHVDGESTAFIEFMLEQINGVLDEILNSVGNTADAMSEYVKRLLSVMEYDTPYTSKDILELLGLRSKETLRKNYLDPAMEAGLVRMTLPDKPNSRNQRYVKV